MKRIQCISKKQVRESLEGLTNFSNSPKYTLKVFYEEKQTRIKMRIESDMLNTEVLPLTYTILKKFLPSIFLSKCFNDGELPFKIEVRKTETGHLFEHILLEYLCDFKIKKGVKKASYVGETSWNWKKEKRGLFNITVSAGILEKDIFDKALSNTIVLFNYILANGSYQKAPLFHQDLASGRSFSGSTSS